MLGKNILFTHKLYCTQSNVFHLAKHGTSVLHYNCLADDERTLEQNYGIVPIETII